MHDGLTFTGHGIKGIILMLLEAEAWNFGTRHNRQCVQFGSELLQDLPPLIIVRNYGIFYTEDTHRQDSSFLGLICQLKHKIYFLTNGRIENNEKEMRPLDCFTTLQV